jgi:hypothetical protein
MSFADFINNVHMIGKKDETVTLTSLFAHLLDQLSWSMISAKEAVFAGDILIGKIAEVFERNMENKIVHKRTIDDCTDAMLDSYVSAISTIALSLDIQKN